MKKNLLFALDLNLWYGVRYVDKMEFLVRVAKFKSLNFNILLIFFLFLNIFLYSKPPELTSHLTKRKADEIFNAHVSHKKFTQEIARRTLQNFLEALDPTKTYFIENELIKWTQPEEALLEKLTLDYKRENFEEYEQIYEIMVSAIHRRNQLEKRILELPIPKNVNATDFKELKWVQTEEELINRILCIRSLQLESAQNFDFETIDQFILRLNKQRLNREQEILQTNNKDQKKQLLAFFLKAFCPALDSHTVYFTPSEAYQFMIQVQQRLFGIGAQLRDDLNGFTLMSFIEGGPAEKNGKLKTGDRIIAVNNEPVVGLDIIETVELIRGPKGTTVTLTLLRDSPDDKQKKAEKFDIEIVRDEIVLKETRFETENIVYGDGIIAHIRLFSFYQDPIHSSASDIKNVINELKETHKLNGVILDLRGNSGGVLPQAVAVTGLFIKKGIVVSIKDSDGNIQHLRNFEKEPAWDGPLIVLTNKSSASAAEIVAQTLQDYKRAILVGDPYTWGKGSYQTFTLEAGNVNKISPQGEFKVTRGLYYTVSGRSPQQMGTKVDIAVPGSLAEIEIGEAFAKFPLENNEIPPNYLDNLADIHPLHRGKMMRLYKKNQQSKIDIYEPLISLLQKNSELRISKNKNYQNFLTEIRKKDFDPENIEKYGQNDLQLDETVQIMKDLIFLYEKNPKTEEQLKIAE